MFTPFQACLFLLLPAWATFEYTSFLFDPHRCAKMEYGPARVAPGVPAWSGACPRGRGLPARPLVGLPARPLVGLPARPLVGLPADPIVAGLPARSLVGLPA